MLTTIGRSGGGKPELWQNLLDCHERIRRFTLLARKLGQPAPVDEVAEAAAATLRYFTVALPLHAADEESSIAPRLAEGATPELAELLGKMSAEHGPIHQVVADLVPLWQIVAAEPARHADLMPRLYAPAAWLGELFESHLRPEEELIFPAMNERLTPLATAEILAEMRARRA